MTGKKVSKLICRSIHNQRGGISTDVVKLQLLTSIMIHPVLNVSQIVQYKEQVEGQKKEKGKLIELEGVEEEEIKKIINKRKIQKVDKYLV